MKAVCPNHPDHKQFTTIAHVEEVWLVDDTGDFIDVVEQVDTVKGPDHRNVWECGLCGATAKVSEN